MPSTATVPTAVIPVTGLTSTGSESYGGQNISHLTMTPGQTISRAKDKQPSSLDPLNNDDDLL